MADGMIEVAKATVTIVPNMKGAQTTITNQMTNAAGPAGKTAGAKGGKNMLSGIVAGISGLAPALMALVPVAMTSAVVKGLYNIGEEFDETKDTIIIGTGATGTALEELQDIANNIATSIPTTFEDAGDTVQDLNTRLGLTGETLEDVGGKILEAGNLIGEEFDTEAFAGAMAAWGESSKEMSSDLDTLFAVAQATGIGMNDLVGITESVAPTMKNLGYDFDDTAAMAGLLDKAGLDASGTLSKMAKGMVTLAQDGEEPVDAMQRVIEQIQGYIDKGDKAKALDLAASIFGTRGASQFMSAVESGALNVEDFAKQVSNSDGIIEDTAEKTNDFSEKMQIFRNRIKEMLEPIATPIFDAISDGIEWVSDTFEELGISDTIAEFMDGFKAAFGDSGIKDVLKSFKEFLGPFLEVAAPNAETLGEAIGQIMGKLTSGALDGLLTSFKWVAKISKIIVGRVFALAEAWENFKSKVDTVVSKIKAIPDRIRGIIDRIRDIFSKVKEAIIKPFQTAWEFIKTIPDKIANAFKGLGDKIKSFIGSITPTITMKTKTFLGKEISIPSITWGAKGGILDGAQLIGAGEAGKEALLPLDRNTGWMDDLAERVSGGNTFNISMTVDGAKDPALYADEFTRQLKRMVRVGAV